MALEGTVEKGVFTNPNKFVLMLMCHKKYSNLKRNTICIENYRQKNGLSINEEKTRYAYMKMSPAQVQRYLHGIIIR
jgi:hypothetical protein